MRPVLFSLLLTIGLAMVSVAQQQQQQQQQKKKSWNKIQYVGGTLPIKTSPYDWNTTISITATSSRTAASIVISVAPASISGHTQTVRLSPSQITAVVCGPGAWRRTANVAGAMLPAKAPNLFGLLLNSEYLAILYTDSDGKPGAILLNCLRYSAQIARVIEALTGQPTEYASGGFGWTSHHA